MSKIKTEDKKNNRRDIELPPNVKGQASEVEIEPSEAEKMLEASRPYWGHLALGVLTLLLGYVLLNLFTQNSATVAAGPWKQLDLSTNQFRINQNVDSLKQMENDFPNEKATNFALQLAGDYELNRGLQQMVLDREGGMKLVKRAKESFQKVYDAPSTTKTVMQQRRALFNVAYAAESLGEFEEAKALYSKYIEEAPDSLLYRDAERGLARVSSPEFIALFNEFKNHSAFDEEAPGAAVEDAPNIEFPEIDIPKDMEGATETKDGADTGGDFEAVKPEVKSVDEMAEVKEATEPMEDAEGKADEPEGDEAAKSAE